MKYSVIIPVYNGSKYLRECLDSVLCQTFADFEAIVVNDGSTDDSGAIIKEYALKDGRIKPVTIENAGSFHARNRGIREAKGEYVLFIDCDDEWERNLIEKVDGVLQSSGADVVVFSFKEINGNGKFVRQGRKTFDRTFEGDALKDYYTILFSETRYNALCMKCYRRSLLDVAVFDGYPRVSMSDDLICTLELSANVKKVVECDMYPYLYRIHGASMVRTYSKSNEIDVLVYREMLRLCDRLPSGDGYKETVAKRFLKDCAVTYLFSENKINGKEDVYEKDVKSIAANPVYIEVYDKFIGKTGKVVRYVNGLIRNGKIKKLKFYKKIIQKPCVNRFLRKIYKG